MDSNKTKGIHEFFDSLKHLVEQLESPETKICLNIECALVGRCSNLECEDRKGVEHTTTPKKYSYEEHLIMTMGKEK